MERTTEFFGTSLKYWSDVAAIELRNIEAFGLAQQKMLEGWGLLAQRQAEIAQGTLSRSLGLHAPGTVGEQIESLKTTILESQANSNILTELATRSSGEAAGILQTRLLASLDEWKAALGQVVLPSTAPIQIPAPSPAPSTAK
jgi:hypothetical protein